MPPSRAATPPYWCYLCNRFVRVLLEDAIACPDCHGGFLEERASPPPRLPIAAKPGHRRIPSATDGSPPRTSTGDRSSPFNPGIILRIPSRGGQDEHGPATAISNVALYFHDDNHPWDASIDGFLMEFDIGRLLQQYLTQIQINGTGREREGEHPPASKAAIESMPTIEITDDDIGKNRHCAICKEPFELGAEAREMPCEHIYHQDCIFRWLSMRNSCPVCRRLMPAEEGGRDAEPPAISGSDEQTTGLAIWRLLADEFAGGGTRAGDPELPVFYTEMDGGFTGDGPTRTIHWRSRGIFRAVCNFFSFLWQSPSRPSS